jgi:uncharacterized protein
MSYNSVVKQSGSVSSTENLPIYFDLYAPVTNHGTPVPVLLFVHGFKGFKDWGAFPDACLELARSGFGVVTFNLSLNGVGKSMTEFDEPELFARETLTQDLEDIGSVIQGIKTKQIAHEKVTLDTDRIGIIGHSRGGHTAVVAAAEYADIHCLVTWSAVADYNAHWSKEMVNDWKKKGYTEILNSRTGQKMRIDKVVYDDAQQNADRLMAVKRAQELYIPCMFIAAKDDEAVPYNDSVTLSRKSPAQEKELRLIEDTGHTFGVSHPFEGEDFPEPFSDVMDLTEGWFLEHLR